MSAAALAAATVGPAVFNPAMPITCFPAPGEPRLYALLTADGRRVEEFLTGPEPWEGGRSAHEVAVTNCVAWSDEHPGWYVAVYLPEYGEPVALVVAHSGVGTLLEDADAVAADSEFGRGLTPEQREHARHQYALRRSTYEPTQWGEALSS